MTKETKSKPLAHDPALAAAEAERRETLAGNHAYQAGIAAAQRVELANRTGELAAAVADLARIKRNAGRGNLQAAVDGYGRVYNRIRRLAQQVYEAGGGKPMIPAFDPPSVTGGAMVPFEPETPPSEHYHESKGMGASGKGGPLPGAAGTDADAAWLSVLGAK